MKITLKKRPKNPIIINGFPGFGMVGTIATEFLIEHLKTEQIGKVIFEEMPALIAIHEGKLVEPFGIFYNKKYNIVIVHSLGGSQGTEWKVSEMILQVAKELKAKEIVSLEGVASPTEETRESKAFYYASKPENDKRLSTAKVEPLKEGIIMGVTSALLLKSEGIPITCIFAETHTNLPDSKAAAKVIETLDKYLNLEVDPKPLLKMAERFEEKLKHILQQSQTAKDQKDKKALSYVG